MNLPNPPLKSDDCQQGSDHVLSTETKLLAGGDAALAMIECLVVVLIEHRIVAADDGVVAVEAAIAVKRQMAADGDHPEIA